MTPETWKPSIERLLRLRPRQLALELAYQVNREFVEALLAEAEARLTDDSAFDWIWNARRHRVISDWLRGNAEGARQFQGKE